MLTDAQIDRYSRQIILPEVGGVGQERLLAAQMTLLAEADDLTPALNYLAGAGVGAIHLDCPGDAGRLDLLIAQMAQLNPEVRLGTSAAQAGHHATLLVLAASNRIIDAARQINENAAYARVIFARLGKPTLIAALPPRPPCLACASPALLEPVERGSFAAPVAMAAAAETIKMLLSVAPQPARLIEFIGYESRSSRLDSQWHPGCARCA